MAGERIGKTYEALVKVALDYLKESGKIDGNVYWNETPEGLSVEPDFVLGHNIDKPDVVIMVTHSGSSKNSDMKCWRNIGELTEIKTLFSKVPLSCNIIFDATMKAGLKSLQEACFDGQLIVAEKEYGIALLNWAKTFEPHLPKFCSYQRIRPILCFIEKIFLL